MEKRYTGREFVEAATLYGNIRIDLAILGIARTPTPRENKEEIAKILWEDKIPRLRAMIDSDSQRQLDLDDLESKAKYWQNFYKTHLDVGQPRLSRIRGSQ